MRHRHEPARANWITRRILLPALVAAYGCSATGGARIPYASRIAPPVASRPPAPSLPLYLDVWATVHGSAVGPLFPDMALHNGDRIGLQARTSIAANVYLVHCDAGAVLSVFPASGAIAVHGDERVMLPAPGMDLRLGEGAGEETLYVIAARRPLEEADPELAGLLSKAQSGAGGECSAAEKRNPPRTRRAKRAAGSGSALEATMIGEQAILRQDQVTLRGLPVHRGVQASLARAFADDDGVIVLRFPYRHAP